MTDVQYYLMLCYIAPENATDAKGNPVGAYNRPIPLDKELFQSVVKQIEDGYTFIKIKRKLRFNDGHLENSITCVNLNNVNLLYAYTGCTERMSQEDADKAKADGKALILDVDGRPMKILE